MKARRVRIERDSLGPKAVPAAARYGVFTQRARETFHLTGRPPHPALVRAYARVKSAAARANARLGLIPRRSATAIVRAADRIVAGGVPDVFVLDALHAGAGTPIHMNVNEVIANLANERLGGRRGAYDPVHPNDHVNLGQSSNDVTPTAIRLMALELERPLAAELAALERAFRRLAARERRTVKPGRTHLQDAVPITWGQVFTGYAEALAAGARALARARDELRVIGLGGTAVGTGLTAHPRFRLLVARELSRLTGRRLVPATSHVTAAWSLRPLLVCSGALRGIAVDLAKICFDLRLLASGPHTAIAEIVLPEVEPGSSIMPGKVNPSVPEAVHMASFQVAACDHAVALAAAAGELELNVMTPLVALALGDAFDLLTRGVRLLRERCVDGLRVDRERSRQLVAGSLIEATALSPYLGYEVMADVVKKALASRRPLRDVVTAEGLVDRATLARLLRPEALTSPGVIDVRLRRRLQSTPAYRRVRDAARGAVPRR
ncbi:MAG: aspartate ammonia-lyase [Candidatus Rokubacteria bacterium]|nr:aspartate ammonia-lyase [Candidatus Rokubacteria bacterium]